MAASPEQEKAPAAVPAEEKKAPEPPKELEQDAKKESSPRNKDTVTFLTPDTTMNVLQSTVGNVLMPLTEGGLSQLVACARASVGVKSGRYMFEAKIVEHMAPHPFVRLGFSTEGSLFLGEAVNSICFDNEGFMVSNRKKTKCSAPFARDVVVAVLLNLDEKSENCNTISLFREGKRVCQPQPLPEELKGKTLYPTISFQNTTVHFNFAAPIMPLPFKCFGVQEAGQNHVAVTKYPEPQDGKHSALFPVSLPDEGTFDWLDSFLEKNPDYTELSDRAFADWALKSGVKAKGNKQSNDSHGSLGLHDVKSIKRTLMELAALQPRNFVIMEVKGNLIKEERQKILSRFNNSVFKTVAEVVIGDAPSAFKKIVQAKVLRVKQDKSDQEHRSKFLGEKREWQGRKKTKENEKLKKQREKEAKKKAEEAARNREAAMKKAKKEMLAKKAAAEGKEVEPEPEEEKEEEKVVEDKESEEEPMEADEPEPVETACPTVALTAEDKNIRFFNHPVKDITEKDLALSFTKFSLPDSGEFSAVKYSWAKEKDASAYVKNWIMERKLTTRVEDITPSAWFKQKSSAWQSELGKWKSKHNEYKSMLAKKAAAKQAKAQQKLAAEKKAKQEAEKKAKEAEEKKDDVEKKEDEPAAEKAAETVPDVVAEVEEEPEVEIDFDGLDVFGVEDVTDVGGKMPLFRDFAFEDFAMMSLRLELHLLVHAFSKDCTDPDRKGIPCDHLAFYYQKYFGRELHLNSYGVQTAAGLVELVKDCILVTKENVLESVVPSELESNAVFAKITEAARRYRHLQLDMGEESARLKIKADGRDGKQQGDHKSGQKPAWGGEQKFGQKRAWGGDGKAAGGKGAKGAWEQPDAKHAKGWSGGKGWAAGGKGKKW